MGGASWAKVPRQRTLRSLGYLPEICLLLIRANRCW
jgi:hypothetical protein